MVIVYRKFGLSKKFQEKRVGRGKEGCGMEGW